MCIRDRRMTVPLKIQVDAVVKHWDLRFYVGHTLISHSFKLLYMISSNHFRFCAFLNRGAKVFKSSWSRASFCMSPCSSCSSSGELRRLSRLEYTKMYILDCRFASAHFSRAVSYTHLDVYKRHAWDRQHLLPVPPSKILQPSLPGSTHTLVSYNFGFTDLFG